MKLFRTFCLLLFVLVYGKLYTQSINPGFTDGELFWRVAPGTQTNIPDSILQQFQITSVNCPFQALNPQKLAGKELISQLHRTYKIQFTASASIGKLTTYLNHLPGTELVEKVPQAQQFYTPNDPQFGTQWNLAKIDASNAWNLSFGNPNVRVAVVDDAVLTSHQDLSGAIWVNPGEIAGNGIDDDGNGYVDDVSGYDVADNDNNPQPPLAFATSSVFTHGTHCAGIVGATTNNSIGISSIGFGLKIIPVKCNNDATPGPSLPNAYDGVTYAITLTPEVMSLSWGGPSSSATYQTLFDVAYANGIMVIAAAGNSNVVTPMYPASYNHVTSVAATDPTDLKASFSNFGPTIDVSAPGVDILSTLAGSASDYGLQSGTSMATPLVAGLCGLMRSFNPNKTIDQIDSCLKATADPIDALNPGFAGQLGAGRINAFNALQCVSGPPIANFTSNFTHVCPGRSVTFYNQSYGSPTTFQWSFPGAFPNASFSQNPTTTYNFAGTYTVRLIVSNALGRDTMIFSSIVVGLPSATMSGGGLINVGSPAFINVNFVGSPPFAFTYTDGFTNTTISGITTNSYTFTVSPPTTRTYSLVSMNDVQCNGTRSGTAVVTVSNGCAASFNFQDIMGGVFMDNPAAAKQTPDCGYVVAGNTFSYGTGLYDAVLMKLDQYGDMVWFKTYGDISDNSYFMDVIPVSNGYVCAGNRGVNNAGGFYFVKTDLSGNVLWEQQIRYTSGGGAVSSQAYSIQELSNGDIAVGGFAMHSNFNTTGQAMMRLNGVTGALIWSRVAQVSDYEGGYGIIQTGAGNLVGAGYSRSGSVSSGLYDMSLTKRDGVGNLIWSKNYGGPGNEYLRDLVRLPDHGFISVGYTEGFSSSVVDIVLMRTDSIGNLIWSKKYARPAADFGYKIVAGCNGKYYIAGSSRTANNGNDALLFQIDINGNVLWAKTIGGILDDGDDVGLGRTGDCGCILTASTISYGVGENDFMIVKTDSLGAMSCHSTPATLTVTNITPTVRVSSLGSNTFNSPQITAIPTFVTTAIPEVQDSVCDACGTPVANFDFVTNYLSLALLDNSVNGQTWHWTFGDGSVPDTMRNAVHVYPGPGTYTVTLIVSSPCGSDTLSKMVTITGLNECLHVLQPGPVNGFDAPVFSRDDALNVNSGSAGYLLEASWTWSGNPGTFRSYLKFDLSRICNSANLLEARFSANYSTTFGQPHSGTNNALMYRCTSLWDEYSVTWLNQPTVTAINGINVPLQTGSNNLVGLVVTPLFQDLITGPNYGFQWRLQTESSYRRTMWASSDWPDPTERPLLTLKFDPIFAHAQVGANPTQHSVNICRGDSIQLNMAGYLNSTTTTGPSIATRYLWVPSTGLSCDTCPNPMASPDSTITYKAVAYNCPSCADIDTIRVTVSQVWVDAPDQILCTGDSVQMQAFHPIAGSTSFIWTPTTNLSNPNVQNPMASPTVPTWYYVTATDAATGCVSTDSAYVLTGNPPVLPVLINDTALICNNGTVIFPLNPNFTPIGSDFYSWNLVGNITPDPNAPSSDAIINTNIAPASYHFILSAINSFGCETKDSVDVIVDCFLPAGQIQFFGQMQDNGNLLEWITSENLAAKSFSLERSSDGLHFQTIHQTESHTQGTAFQYEYLDAERIQGDHYYRLKTLALDGQEYLSEIILLSNDFSSNLSIYPNPTHDFIELKSTIMLENATVGFYDAAGKAMIERKGISGTTIQFELENMPAGIYLMKVTEAGKSAWMKVIVQ